MVKLSSLQQAAQDLVNKISYMGASPLDWPEYTALEEALEAEQAQAVEPVSPSLRPPRTAQEFKFGMNVLNWNRRQSDPPIDVGRELWVAATILKLQAFNDCQPQKVAASMTMTEIVAAAGVQSIDVYAASFMSGIRAAEAHHGITQGDKE